MPSAPVFQRNSTIAHFSEVFKKLFICVFKSNLIQSIEWKLDPIKSANLLKDGILSELNPQTRMHTTPSWFALGVKSKIISANAQDTHIEALAAIRNWLKGIGVDGRILRAKLSKMRQKKKLKHAPNAGDQQAGLLR